MSTDAPPTAHPVDGPARSSTWLTTLGWAAYLACSWTWCIGMFLPVLLVRDFGVWGFVVFAVPNVIGAGAMGWVIGRERSRGLVRKHRAVCSWFSYVTMAFHFFCLGWIPWLVVPEFDNHPSLEAMALASLGVAVCSYCLFERWVLRASALVLLMSLACALVLQRNGVLDTGDVGPFRRREMLPDRDLVWLAPVCAFGFGLCPYLDLTFHRAASEQPAGRARVAFTLGFGVFFVIMILITLLYTPWLALNTSTSAEILYATWILAVAFLFHFVGQSVFTMRLHFTELRGLIRISARTRRWASTLVGIALAALATACYLSGPLTYHAMTVDEVIYRCFMAFYGLVFPAYVWLCMIPTRDGHSGPSRGKVMVWAIAVAVAAPMFWMGFIERATWWLGPGLGVVLVARLGLPRVGLRADRTEGSSAQGAGER